MVANRAEEKGHGDCGAANVPATGAGAYAPAAV